jgi:hypothetical protein
MRHINIIIFFGLCGFLFCVNCMAEQSSTGAGIVFRGDKVDIQVKDVPLENILSEFKKARGISYQGDKSLLDSKLTGEVTGVSVEEALKRILFNFDHAMIYDKNKNLIGIRITGKGEGKDIQTNDSETMEFHEANIMESEPIYKTFQVKRDCGPPHGAITYTPEQRESFTPEKNVPPPGGLPEKPAITNDQIRKNVPPPGGLPPEMTK